MQLLWTWSHSNSNNKAVVRAWGSLAMLKMQEAHLMLEGALFLQVQLSIARSSSADGEDPCPQQRWMVELWDADVSLAWARVRSSGPRADSDSAEQCAWQRGCSSQRLSQCSPATPATCIVLLVEDSIQLMSKNPFPCSSAGSTLSHWSFGNHSGLTQGSSDDELCCTFMWAPLERARRHLV